MTAARGVALLEVVFALVLVAVGWMALLGLQGASVRLAVDTSLREEARWALQAVADSLDRVVGEPGEVAFAWGSIAWAASEGGWLLRAAAADARPLAELWTRGGGGGAE